MLDSITKITSDSEYKQVQLTAVIIDKIFDTNDGTKKELATLRVIGREFTFNFLTHYSPPIVVAIPMRFELHCKLSLQQ